MFRAIYYTDVMKFCMSTEGRKIIPNPIIKISEVSLSFLPLRERFSTEASVETWVSWVRLFGLCERLEADVGADTLSLSRYHLLLSTIIVKR